MGDSLQKTTFTEQRIIITETYGQTDKRTAQPLHGIHPQQRHQAGNLGAALSVCHGYRYRLNHPRLPGHPDIVMRKYRTVIFVNGCFWHGHEGCKYFVMPKSRTDFWQAKIERNQTRDKEEQHKLASMGWHCITIWECQLKPKVREQTLQSLEYTLNHIFLEDHKVKRYELPEEDIMMAAEPEIGHPTW